MNHRISEANTLMKQGAYKEAIAVYKDIEASDPFWADKVVGNIYFAKNKIINNKKSIQTSTHDTNTLQIEKLSAPLSLAQPHTIYLEDIYKNIHDINKKTSFKKMPLVTIAVTAHNTEEYIEASIRSLLNQTYKNIEIIVVDDQSIDNTLKILHRLSKTDKRLQYKQLVDNLGTYFAKNYAISISKGEYIFFQDSDDICHPRRIEIMLDQLLNSGKTIIRGAYSRLDPNTNRIIPVNGQVSKLGLITLGVKKEVFKKIGYFHCTTKASDDEFFQRACKFVGKLQIENNNLPLYYNTYRDGSLFADMVTITKTGEIIQKPSASRQNYLENFTAIHKKYETPEQIQRLFRFPQVRNTISVMPDMTKLSNPADLIIFNVCSIPARESSLKKSINSIIDQCDKINVYLDGYKEIPEFLEKYSNKCKIIQSEKTESLRDNGKFLALQDFTNSGKNAYYFTIDDDIIYPPDYTNHLIKKIEYYSREAVIGVHGVILKNNPKSYFSDGRIVYSFTKSLEKDVAVNILGTGTIAFHTSIFKKFNINYFRDTGMVDILFAIYCKEQNIPQISINRLDSWLIDQNPTPEQTLYHEFKDNDSKQSIHVSAHSPWGYYAINSIITKKKFSNIKSLQKILTGITF